MQKRRLRSRGKVAVLAVLAVLAGSTTVFATSSSPNYQVTDTSFNAGLLDGCSTSYCARASMGELVVGNSTDNTHTATFGAATGGEPLLEVIVEPGESNLGTLTSETTGTSTAIVKIRNYLSNGYVLQLTGDPPKYGNHMLATPSTPTASTPGTEQFGINIVDNSTPNIGASPAQEQSAEFGHGFAETNYASANQFMYTSGDNIGRSLTSSGQTNYTISIIVNISNSTPAGKYTGDYAAVVIPVY